MIQVSRSKQTRLRLRTLGPDSVVTIYALIINQDPQPPSHTLKLPNIHMVWMRTPKLLKLPVCQSHYISATRVLKLVSQG